MTLDELFNFVPTFLLVYFRLAGMMLFAPLFGSSRIPKRLKALLVGILAMAVTGGMTQSAVMPQSLWQLAVGVGGEMTFGLAMGMVMGFVFVAVQWAGEIIGQQMGLNMGEMIDPQFGGQGSVIGDLYYMLTLTIFLTVGGHKVMLRGVLGSFKTLPLLSAGLNENLFHTLVELLQASAQLAIQLAAPMLVTILVVDLALGLIGRAVPALNVMSTGLSIRSVIGMIVVIIGLGISTKVIGVEVLDSMEIAYSTWTDPGAAVPSPDS